MSDILSWLKEYSPAMATLIMLGAGFLFVLKLVVERVINSRFDVHAKEVELLLERQSAFKDKVLTERFTFIANMSARLEKVMTNLNRHRHGQALPDGFFKDSEIVPLTEIYEDLTIHRLVITEEFFNLFIRKANLALQAANIISMGKAAQATTEDHWNRVAGEWMRLSEEIRALAEKEFKISEVRM